MGTGRKLVNTMEEHDYYYSRQRDTSIEKRESTGTEAVRVFREDWPSSRKLDENVMNERERERERGGVCAILNERRSSHDSLYGQRNRGKATTGGIEKFV